GNDEQFRYESATLLATVLHMHRGTPYVYQSDEIGMTNVPFTQLSDYRDIESLNYYNEAVAGGADPAEILAALQIRSRDNARTPVQWDASANAGFTTGEPWIAVNPNYRDINVAADRASERSIFRYYQRLIELRHSMPVVALGDFQLLEPEHPHLYAFTRTLAEETLLIVANVSNDPLLVDLIADRDPAEIIIGNYSQADATVLGPWEARVYR
ncbi:MAG TPA: alpha-glucosidase C-terminal domain-containing protein, partial [Glaciihabitans sp.]|nr:alpha-glucosidase C-terminal domain-containing protein [Glaciihabitans sp.]